MAGKDPLDGPITRDDLKQATGWANAVIDLAEKYPAVAEELGITHDQVAEARVDVAENEKLLQKVPSARAVFIGGVTGMHTREEILTRYSRTILGIHGLAPMAGMVLAAKLDDEKSPGSLRAALEILKGTGVFVPAEPIKAKAREELLSEDALREKDDDSLRREVLDQS